MIKTIWCVIFLLVGTLGYSQDQFYDTTNQSFSRKTGDVKGTPYEFENWKKGYVFTIKGDSMLTAMINYNGYSKLFEIKEEGNYIALNEKYHNKIKIRNGYAYETYKNRLVGSDLEYYQVLYEGENVSLLKRHEVKIKERGESNYAGSVKSKKYKNSTVYYLLDEEGYKELNRKDKFFEKYFRSKKVKKFIKDNKLKLKKDMDLIKAVEYGDTFRNAEDN